MKDFGLYIIITKPLLPYTRIAEICAANEIKMLQLREKHLSDREVLPIARRLREVTRGTATRLIINDRPDIALLAEAEGVHLGREDLPLEEVRRLVPPGTLIGKSTHSISQAREALTKRPDYIGFGPLYPTTTKEKPDPVVGPGKLKEVLSFSPVPVVAIGGIGPENLTQVLEAGARNICMVSYFMETKALERRIQEIQSAMDSYWNRESFRGREKP